MPLRGVISRDPGESAALSFSPMTPKQARFVDEYLIDLNATQAAIRAGYSARTADRIGPELLGKTCVAAAITAAQAERSERVEVTQDYVVQRLVDNVERAMQAEPVRDREGNETGGYTYQGAVANGALKLLGLHLGMFVEKHEHTGRGGGPIETAALTEEQAAARVTQLLAIAASRKGRGS